MFWTLTQLDPTRDGTRTWTYGFPREAWAAYQRRIAELETSGWVRQGPETTPYGQGASQEMRRADVIMIVQLARTPNPEA